ncbi:MAG: DUF359 domain-containing protein [Methanomicrobiales archaeon]|nr:DUF359 domain-containing protein [Methanomicrobiales archaeon]
MLVLPEKHRHLFKEPFGNLFISFDLLLEDLPESQVFCVGDVVTANLLKAGRPPDIAIIDGHTMRQPYPGIKIPEYHQIFVKNPAGGLTEELIQATKIASEQSGLVIQVEGEEDLAVVPLAMHAPIGATILYGQPGEGVVMLRITQDAKMRAKRLLACFEEVESHNCARDILTTE